MAIMDVSRAAISDEERQRLRQRVLRCGRTFPVFATYQLYIGRPGAAKERVVLEQILADLESEGVLTHAVIPRERGRAAKLYFLAPFSPQVRQFWRAAKEVTPAQ